MQSGVVLGLVLLAWSQLVPHTVAGAQPTGAAFDEIARATAPSDVTATPRLGAMPLAACEPTPAPTPLRPDSQENVTPTASKLSRRARILANLATTGSLPADLGEQDRLLGLSDSGAGSLARDAAGNPIVDVRVVDTSAETITAITALPADVLSISPEYATVTLAISPGGLNDLASLAAVQYVSEVIRPAGNPSLSPGELPGHGGVAPGTR